MNERSSRKPGTESGSLPATKCMKSEPKSEEPGNRSKREPALNESLRDVAPYLTLGIQLAAAIIFFFLIGWWLDSKYDTSPALKIVGLLIGAVGGMIKFLRSAVEMGKKDKSP